MILRSNLIFHRYYFDVFRMRKIGCFAELVVLAENEIEGCKKYFQVPEHRCKGDRPHYEEDCGTKECPKWVAAEWSGVSFKNFLKINS